MAVLINTLQKSWQSIFSPLVRLKAHSRQLPAASKKDLAALGHQTLLKRRWDSASYCLILWLCAELLKNACPRFQAVGPALTCHPACAQSRYILSSLSIAFFLFLPLSASLNQFRQKRLIQNMKLVWRLALRSRAFIQCTFSYNLWFLICLIPLILVASSWHLTSPCELLTK